MLTVLTVKTFNVILEDYEAEKGLKEINVNHLILLRRKAGCFALVQKQYNKQFFPVSESADYFDHVNNHRVPVDQRGCYLGFASYIFIFQASTFYNNICYVARR